MMRETSRGSPRPTKSGGFEAGRPLMVFTRLHVDADGSPPRPLRGAFSLRLTLCFFGGRRLDVDPEDGRKIPKAHPLP